MTDIDYEIYITRLYDNQPYSFDRLSGKRILINMAQSVKRQFKLDESITIIQTKIQSDLMRMARNKKKYPEFPSKP